MKSEIRARFWVEAGLASLCGVLAVVTIFNHDWIELRTGFDPDQNDGSFEWTIVVVLFVVCVLLALAARAEWRRPGAGAAARP